MAKGLKQLLLGVVIGLVLIAGGILLLSWTLGNPQIVVQGRPIEFWMDQSKSQNPAASNELDAVLAAQIIPRFTEEMFHDTNDSSFRLALVKNLNSLPGVFINYTPAEGRRARAASILGQFGPRAKAAIPALLEAAKGHDDAVRSAAVTTLGQIHGDPDHVIPLLITLLDDKELNDESAEALGNYGGLAKAAIPKLIPLLQVNDNDLHGAVVEALRKIDPDAALKAGVK